MALNQEKFTSWYNQEENSEVKRDKVPKTFFRCVKNEDVDGCLFLIPFLKDTYDLTICLEKLGKMWPQKIREEFFEKAIPIFDKNDMDELPLIKVWSKEQFMPSSSMWDVASGYSAFGSRNMVWGELIALKVSNCIKNNDKEGLEKLKEFNLSGRDIFSKISVSQYFDDFLENDFSLADYDNALYDIAASDLTSSEKQRRGGIILNKALEKKPQQRDLERFYLIFEADVFLPLKKRLIEKCPNCIPSNLQIFMARAYKIKNSAFSISPKVYITDMYFEKIASNAISIHTVGDVSSFFKNLKKYVINMDGEKLNNAVYRVLIGQNRYKDYNHRKKMLFFKEFEGFLTISQKVSYILHCARENDLLLFTQALKSLNLETIKDISSEFTSSLNINDADRFYKVIGNEISRMEKRLLKQNLKEKLKKGNVVGNPKQKLM